MLDPQLNQQTAYPEPLVVPRLVGGKVAMNLERRDKTLIGIDAGSIHG